MNMTNVLYAVHLLQEFIMAWLYAMGVKEEVSCILNWAHGMSNFFEYFSGKMPWVHSFYNWQVKSYMGSPNLSSVSRYPAFEGCESSPLTKTCCQNFVIYCETMSPTAKQCRLLQNFAILIRSNPLTVCISGDVSVTWKHKIPCVFFI